MADGNHIASDNGGWIAAFVTGCFALLQALIYRRKKKAEPEPINGSRTMILNRLSLSEENYRQSANENRRLEGIIQDLAVEFRESVRANREWQRDISSEIRSLQRAAD